MIPLSTERHLSPHFVAEREYAGASFAVQGFNARSLGWENFSSRDLSRLGSGEKNLLETEARMGRHANAHSIEIRIPSSTT